ncbi:hypothetical protein RDI58_027422 [Solanum bulbocastanum]|uniref:Uncharacterized protein n=1 Tax=Solanum bulbocastanum TaxID=147425 RepID=A0AAN8T3B7_SOLBU
MEKVMNILKPKPNPQQILRDWQRRLRQECRNIERQIRDIQREEKTVQKAIKEAAKRNDMGSAKALAKEIVRSKKTVNRLYENKAQLNSISMHLGESVGSLKRHNAGVMEEMVNDAVDSALDSEDMEEEIEEEVDKVLTAIAGETTAQLPEAVRKEKLKQPAQAVEDAEQTLMIDHSSTVECSLRFLAIAFTIVTIDLFLIAMWMTFEAFCCSRSWFSNGFLQVNGLKFDFRFSGQGRDAKGDPLSPVHLIFLAESLIQRSQCSVNGEEMQIIYVVKEGTKV